jgi:hypothetical protein
MRAPPTLPSQTVITPPHHHPEIPRPGSLPKGSKWRKWDLHVHTPASHQFAGDWNQFVIQLGNADCDVVGINDYFSVAGYKEVQRLLSDPGAGAEGNKPYREALGKLKAKTLLPVVECRMNNVVLDKKVKSGPRINFHLIFNPEIAADDIETFIKNLKVKGASIGSGGCAIWRSGRKNARGAGRTKEWTDRTETHHQYRDCGFSSCSHSSPCSVWIVTAIHRDRPYDA